MNQRAGGAVLVECLQALGARQSFGIPGESYLAVLNALYDTNPARNDSPTSLDFFLCRHEGGAAFMAAAYGKLTGRPGIGFVTRGPGATNAAIGVHTAMQDSAPMILFIGQVGTGMTGREAFQEIDYRSFFGDVSKWVVEIERIDRIPEILARAWSTALSGRPGPVVVALPEDVLTNGTAVPALTAPAPVDEAAPTPEALQAVVATLSAARRPLILIGDGGWTKTGQNALQRFAEAADIPVLAAFRCQDLYDNHSVTYAGDAGVGMTSTTKTLFARADLLLAIGVRFCEMTTDGYRLLRVPVPEQTLIHVHASDREIGKIYQPHHGIHSGPNAFSHALAHQSVHGSWATWRREARSAYETSFTLPKQPSPVDMGAVTAYLRNRLPADAILTNGAGNFSVWPNRYFQFGPNQRLLAPQSGAMGYGLPAAIAAKVTYPDRTVVCFTGDGDFQMTCQELGSAMQANAQPIVLLLNNHSYGTIRMHQERSYPGRVSGTTLQNPDFLRLGDAYGYHTERVATTADFEAAFERALASKTGALLDLTLSVDAITPHQTLAQIQATATTHAYP